MGVMTRAIDVVPLSRHIGAEIRGLDLRNKPDDETVRAIYQAWLDHLVIVFPGQSLSQEDFVRATGFLARSASCRAPQGIFPGYSSSSRHHADLQHPRNGEPIGALPDGEMMFHHDMIQRGTSKATLLYSVEIPSAEANGSRSEH